MRRIFARKRLLTEPLPLMTLETTEPVSLRLKTRAPLSDTAPLPKVPAAPPVPIWSVPPLIVVVV